MALPEDLPRFKRNGNFYHGNVPGADGVKRIYRLRRDENGSGKVDSYVAFVDDGGEWRQIGTAKRYEEAARLCLNHAAMDGGTSAAGDVAQPAAVDSAEAAAWEQEQDELELAAAPVAQPAQPAAAPRRQFKPWELLEMRLIDCDKALAAAEAKEGGR